MKLKLSLFFWFFCLAAFPQKETKCVVTLSSGAEISGYLKKFNPSGLPSRLTLYNGDKRMRLYSQNIDKVVVNDTLEYKSLINRKGYKLLMTPLVEGMPLSLYRHSDIKTGNLPGQGFSTWIYNEFYIISGNGKPVFVNERKLLKKPEDFFPDAPDLQDSIRGIKRDDLIIKNLVTEYNQIKSVN